MNLELRLKYDEFVKNKIEFIKEDIEIRVESLKAELDLMADKMIKQVDQIKFDFYDENINIDCGDDNLLNSLINCNRYIYSKQQYN